jgi:hypothetical protein
MLKLNNKENKKTPSKKSKQEKSKKLTNKNKSQKKQDNNKINKNKLNKNKNQGKKEANKENIEQNIIINKRFPKINTKILGDTDKCESYNDSEEEEYCSFLNDSLEKSQRKSDKKNINVKQSKSVQKRVNPVKNVNNNKLPFFNYPNLFDNIITNNFLNKTCNNDINRIKDEQFFKDIITNKRNQIIRNKNRSSGLISFYSTSDVTKKKNNKNILENNEVVEFNYEDEENNINNNNLNVFNTFNTFNTFNNINNTISNNASFNVLNKETITENMNILFTKKNQNKSNSNIKENKEIKYWLDNMNLSQYYNIFIENDIYDLNKLTQNKDINFDTIESLLKIHKPGHIYRIFSSLQIYLGLINSNVANFLVKRNGRHKSSKSNNNLKLSISQEIKENNSCVNCFKINFFNSNKKNDLNQFLLRYNLTRFYQNFYHNGFDMINYVMVQMFSSEPINEIILENCFHIYEAKDRDEVLKCLLSEKDKINFFLNSKEYLQFNEKYNIKYEDIIFEKNNNDMNNKYNFQYEKIIIPSNSNCVDCNIF